MSYISHEKDLSDKERILNMTCKKRLDEIRLYREAYFSGASQEELDALNIYMNPEVLASWNSLREASIEPTMVRPYGEPLTQENYEKVLHDNATLVRIVQPVFEKYLYLDSSRFYGLGLITADNVFLIKTKHGFSHFLPSYKIDMKTTGNTGHSMCMMLGQPAQHLSPEHYDNTLANDDFIVSSLPIFDANNKLVATLGYTHYLDKSMLNRNLAQYMRSGFSLASALATAIENQLKQVEKGSSDYFCFDPLTCGTILTDSTGCVVKIDYTAASLLGINHIEAPGKSLAQLFPNQRYIEEIAKMGGKLEITRNLDKDLPVRIHLDLAHSAGGNATKNRIIRLQPEKEMLPHTCAVASNGTEYTFDNIIGTSPPLKKAIQISKQFAKNTENILLTSESGTGKEMFAQSIHNLSRPNAPFMAVNCAALPRELIEAELLGYEGGSFTGADRKGRPGKIELADGGTLFMDEIGDMPLDLQAVLLRVLEDKKVTRIGGHKPFNIDFRVIAATNQNLEEMVEKKQFREDLYYRLSVLPVFIPPLRERKQDIRLLCEYFIRQYCAKFFLPVVTIDESVYNYLENYHWPGNVRQLRNAIVYSENIARNNNCNVIIPEHLPNYLLQRVKKNPGKVAISMNKAETTSVINLKDLERNAIHEAQILTDNNVTRMAALLGISLPTLYRKMKRYEAESNY